MKQWIWFPALLAAACVLSRLPHPAVDVGKLEPVSAVQIEYRDGCYHLRTDTGASGSGGTLEEASRALSQGALGEVFLETAEYVLLDPAAPVTEELYRVLRPACRVCLAEGEVDLQEASAFLAAHPPEATLAELRAGGVELTWLDMEGDGTDGTA